MKDPEMITEDSSKFLKQNFGIIWVKTAKLGKIDNDNAIKVSPEKKLSFFKI